MSFWCAFRTSGLSSSADCVQTLLSQLPDLKVLCMSCVANQQLPPPPSAMHMLEEIGSREILERGQDIRAGEIFRKIPQLKAVMFGFHVTPSSHQPLPYMNPRYYTGGIFHCDDGRIERSGMLTTRSKLRDTIPDLSIFDIFDERACSFRLGYEI